MQEELNVYVVKRKLVFQPIAATLVLAVALTCGACSRAAATQTTTDGRTAALETYLDSIDQETSASTATGDGRYYVITYGIPSEPRIPWLDPSVHRGSLGRTLDERRYTLIADTYAANHTNIATIAQLETRRSERTKCNVYIAAWNEERCKWGTLMKI